MNFDQLRLNGMEIDWSKGVRMEDVLDYCAHMMCWTRLCKVEDAGDGFNTAAYYEQHVMVLDGLQECFAAESLVGFKGQTTFDLLALPLDTDPQSPEYKSASELVWRLLTRSSIQKVYRSGGMLKDQPLGILWDQPEHATQDCAPGTFGELLRYGALHFRQTRDAPLLREAEPLQKLGKRLLEA